MANEFKVRKGLIVEGSGSAVLDIQGSQGQLFSVTDDLTGDIFSVSDISGVPILNVNADGTTTIDGTLTLTNDEVLDSTSDTSIKFLTRDSNGVVKYHTLGSNAFNSTAFTTNTGTTTADNSQTFTNKSGNISQWTNDSGYTTTTGTLTGNGTSGRVPIYNGTTSFTTDSGFTYSSNVLSTEGLTITSLSAQNSEATALMINGSNVVGTRELGSNAFTSTTIGTTTNSLTDGTGITDFTFNGSGAASVAVAAAQTGITSIYNTSLVIGGASDANHIGFSAGKIAFTAGNEHQFNLINGAIRPATDNDVDLGTSTLRFKNIYGYDLILNGLSGQSSEATSLMIDSSGNVGTRELGSNAFNSTSIPSLSSNVTIGGDLTVSGNQVITAGSNADVKFSVWNGSTYGIGMTSGVTYGHLNDYAMTFCMNNDSDRGFWWGYSGQTKSDGAMSLTTAGKLKVKSTIEAQEITAVDTILGRDSQFQRNIVMVTEPADSTSTKALVWEASDAALKIRNIPTNNNQLTNGAGYTTNTGTVTNVQAGNGITVDSGTTTPTVTVAPEARTSSTGDLLINVNGVSRSNYWEIASGLYLQAISDSSGGPRLRSGTGTYSTPSISFKSDTNTGFWGGTDQVNVSCGGSHRAQFAETGLKLISSALGVNVTTSATNGRIDAGNDIVAYSSSDRRWKENIKPIENALSKILKIGGYEFDWKELTEEERKTQHGNEGHDVGVIAQEVEEVLPEVVTTRENGFKGVKYDKMVALLIEGMKEQQSQIEELKSEIKKLKGEL